MYSPPYPGRLIRSDLEALNISVANAANALGVDRSQLHRVLSGKSAISAEMALRLEAVIGSSADHWMRMQNAYDLAQLRSQKADMIKSLKKLQSAC